MGDVILSSSVETVSVEAATKNNTKHKNGSFKSGVCLLHIIQYSSSKMNDHRRKL